MSKTAVAFATVAGVFALSFIMLIAFLSFGWLDINWPWENIDIIEEESVVGIDIEEGPAQIIKIVPLALECKARIKAEVPVVGTHKTTLAGATISTDTIRMRAIGDVDTCVDPSGVEIVDRSDGTVLVLVNADAIEFVRPRVDAVATMGSVSTDKGIVNQVFEALPWTNEDDQLTPAAFAFAQTVIGGSKCMEAAYEQTEQALVAAYEEQMRAQGADPDNVQVAISGIPDFDQNTTGETILGDVEFSEETGTTCIVATR